MKVQFLGTGSAFSKKRNNTCFIVEADRKYMVDCPKNVLKVFYEAEVEPKEINDVIITHLHPDHYGDLETLAMHKRYVEGKKINLITSREIYENLKDKVRYSLVDRDDSMNGYTKIEDFIEFTEIEPEKSYSNNGTEIKVRNNIHPIPTLGVRIDYEDKSVGYSGDTKYEKELIEALYREEKITVKEMDDLLGFLWDSDIILHEVSDKKGIHTELDVLEKLPEKVRESIYLVHLPDDGLKTDLKQAKDYEVLEV